MSALSTDHEKARLYSRVVYTTTWEVRLQGMQLNGALLGARPEEGAPNPRLSMKRERESESNGVGQFSEYFS